MTMKFIGIIKKGTSILFIILFIKMNAKGENHNIH